MISATMVAGAPSSYTYVTPKFDANSNPRDYLWIVANTATTVVVDGRNYNMNAGNVLTTYPAQPGSCITASQPVQVESMRADAEYFRSVTLLPYSKCGQVYRMASLGDDSNMNLMITGFVNATTITCNGTWNVNANEAIIITSVSPGTLIQSTQPIAAYAQVICRTYCRTVTLNPIDR